MPTTSLSTQPRPTWSGVFALALLVCAWGCGEPESSPESAEPVASVASEGEQAGSTEAEPTAEADGCAAVTELAAMDTRQPLPLQPMMAWHQKQNMMEHLVAIQRITAALAAEDWDAIAEASALIETSPQMQRMCEHMGSGAPGFTDQALEFHHRADAIGEAAGTHDSAAVLRATAHTLEACTSCHATYRQDVVDAETWEERTGSAHDPAAMMHGMH